MSERAPYPGHAGVAAIEARKRGDAAYLITMLSGEERRARVAAAQELGKLGAAAGVPALVRSLGSSDDGLKISSLKALAKIGVPDAAEAAFGIAAETGESFNVRSTAAATALRLGDRRALGILVRLLTAQDNPSPGSYTKWVLRLLVEYRGVESIPLLAEAQPRLGFVNRRRVKGTVRRLRDL